MSLVGNLQDLSLLDICQIVGLSKKSGVLRLNHDTIGKGRIIFVDGRIVSAWGPKAIDILADILVEQRLTLPNATAQLHKENVDPLAALKSAFDVRSLGTDRGGVILEEFTKSVLQDFLTWSHGTFQFELMDSRGSEEAIPPDWVLIPEGLSPDYLGLERARITDETQRAEPPPKPEPKPKSGEEALFDLVAELQDQFEASSGPMAPSLSPGLGLLKSMLQELNVPNVHTYITLLVLRFASALMNRAILFEVKDQEYVGLGEFGLSTDKEEAAKLVRSIHIPRAEPSILSLATKNYLAVKAAPDTNLHWDRHLIERLGGKIPSDVFIGPIYCRGRLVAILYGDNVPDTKSIGDTDSLELFLSQAGLAMDRRLAEENPK